MEGAWLDEKNGYGVIITLDLIESVVARADKTIVVTSAIEEDETMV